MHTPRRLSACLLQVRCQADQISTMQVLRVSAGVMDLGGGSQEPDHLDHNQLWFVG